MFCILNIIYNIYQIKLNKEKNPLIIPNTFVFRHQTTLFSSPFPNQPFHPLIAMRRQTTIRSEIYTSETNAHLNFFQTHLVEISTSLLVADHSDP